MNELPIKLDKIWRNEDGTFKKGHPRSSNGRPEGKTLKEYASDYLMGLPEEEKTQYLASLPADIVWRMAEGNPATKLQGDESAPITLVIKDINGNSINTKKDGEREEHIPKEIQ